MKFMLLVYIDHQLIAALPQARYEAMMREFPWTQIGSIEVRAVRDIGRVREQVSKSA